MLAPPFIFGSWWSQSEGCKEHRLIMDPRNTGLCILLLVHYVLSFVMHVRSCLKARAVSPGPQAYCTLLFLLAGCGEYQLHPSLTVKSTGWENRSSNLLASYSLVGCSIHTNNRKQRPQTEVFILWFPPKILVISSRKHRGNLHLFCLSKINEPKWNSLTVLRCLQGFSGLLGDCALTLTDLFLLGPALRQSPSLGPPWKTLSSS